jgi:nitroreductase
LEFFEVIKNRRVHRAFSSRPVPPAIVNKLVFAGGKAPTGANLPYRGFIVVDNPDTISTIKKLSPGYPGISPLIIVVYSNTRLATEEGGKVGEFGTIFDAGAAAENIMLAAISEGLVGCLVKSYPEAAIAEVLSLPTGYRTEIMIAIGYPSDTPSKSVRKRVGADIVYRNKFGSQFTGESLP